MAESTIQPAQRPKPNRWTSFRIDFELSLSEDEGDPCGFILVYDGSIIETNDDDVEQKIGKLSIYVVQCGRVLNEGASLFEVMDCLDGDSYDCFANLFDHETEQLKPQVERLLSEERTFEADLMLIDQVELNPDYRGQGLGKEIILRVIRRLGTNCRVITCMPFPLQYTNPPLKGKQPAGKRSAQRRVREFWEGVGFVRLPRSEYYLWPD